MRGSISGRRLAQRIPQMVQEGLLNQGALTFVSYRSVYSDASSNFRKDGQEATANTPVIIVGHMLHKP